MKQDRAMVVCNTLLGSGTENAEDDVQTAKKDVILLGSGMENAEDYIQTTKTKKWNGKREDSNRIR